MTTRPQCGACNTAPAAINYIKNEVVHYRSVCDVCARAGRKSAPPVPAWVRSGYKQKESCDQCGFRAKHREQISVHHLNGNRADATWTNLKSICANCQIDIRKSKAKWRPSSLTPDF